LQAEEALEEEDMAVVDCERIDVRGVAGLARFSPAVALAWQDSLMASFPENVTSALLEDAREVTVESGEIFYRRVENQETPVIAVIADGLVRTFIEAENGRRVTIRYSGPGEVVGAPASVAGLGEAASFPAWVSTTGRNGVYGEALRDTLMLSLSPTRFQGLAQTEVSVAAALATSLAYGAVQAEQILADGLFQSVRARVARHLMDLAVRRDGELVVAASHQEIADAVGSVREVVSRTLVGMRQEGLVRRVGQETRLLQPARLHAIAGAG
jgi:CRP-like cAMP-binding protein